MAKKSETKKKEQQIIILIDSQRIGFLKDTIKAFDSSSIGNLIPFVKNLQEGLQKNIQEKISIEKNPGNEQARAFQKQLTDEYLAGLKAQETMVTIILEALREEQKERHKARNERKHSQVAIT